MDFSKLPPELVDSILLASVRVRTIKRALRLRLVCRRFSTLVTHAIFASGLILHRAEEIDTIFANDGTPEFWHRYLVYRCVSPRKPLPPALRSIVDVAEHITRHRLQHHNQPPRKGQDHDEDQVRTEVGRRIEQISHLFFALYTSVYRNLLSSEENPKFPPLSSAWESDPEHQIFIAASYLGEIDLVRNLLETPGLGSKREALSWALRAAAHGSRVSVASVLLSTCPTLAPGETSYTLSLVENSMIAGDVEIFQLGLEHWARKYQDHAVHRDKQQLDTLLNITIIDGMFRMQVNLDLFKLAYTQLARGNGCIFPDKASKVVKDHWKKRLERSLTRMCRLCPSNGDVAFMSFLLDNCPMIYKGKLPSLDEIQRSNSANSTRRRLTTASYFLDKASANGHADAVAWLIEERGAHVNMPRSLVSAAQGGSCRVLDMILARYFDHSRVGAGEQHQGDSLQAHDRHLKDGVESALVVAVSREYEAVVRRLVIFGRDLEIDISAALETARSEGLESMAAILTT